MRFAVEVLGVGLLTACRSSGAAPVDAGAAASSTTPTCTSPIVVRAEIHGAFEGLSGSGVRGPFMVVGMDHAPPFVMSGRSFGTVADLELEEPRFAAEYGPADLCSDDGSTQDRIAISCITGPSAKVTKLTVARDDLGLMATIDGKQTRWEPPTWEASRCFELRGLDGKRDLEALRKTWMLDEPKCPRSPSSQPVKVTLRLDPVAAGGGHHDAKVTLLGAGAPRDVGKMTNMSGAVGFRRSRDVNGIIVSASDMGLDRRFVYQLGDRIYYVSEDGRVHAADLPCGTRTKFEVRASAALQVPESTD
jgi:hypothetical protein